MPVTVIEDGSTVEVVQADESVEVSSSDFNVEVDTTPVIVDGIPYTGPYTVTPTRSQQILQTSRLAMTSNVIVEPIPSNYGLITWNGAALTVS